MDFVTMKVLNVARKCKTVDKLSRLLVGADRHKAYKVLKGLTDAELMDMAKAVEAANIEAGTLKPMKKSGVAELVSNMKR